jgi:hypothetical protein
MDADRFDALSRRIGTRTSRRVTLGLAAMGLLTIAVPEAAAARCSNRKPCPTCKRCKRHRCKPDAMKNGTPCSTGTCQQGVCTSSSGCSPAGTGGRECQENGPCRSPADMPVSGACGGLPDACRECCTSNDCSDTSRMECRHNEGSICVCGGSTHECTDGLCWSCCTTEHCVGGRHNADGFICTTFKSCACQEGSIECPKADQTGNFCADPTSNQNCGSCGNTCAGGTSCIDRQCQFS